MTIENIIYFGLGFITATVLIVGVGFFWLKRRWKSLLFGMGAKLFSKGLGAARKPRNGEFREVGRQ
jgi:hypothetical protein